MLQFDSGNGRGALLRHTDAKPGPLGEVQPSDIAAIKNNLSFSHFIGWEAHNGHYQCGLATSIWPQQDVDFSIGDG